MALGDEESELKRHRHARGVSAGPGAKEAAVWDLRRWWCSEVQGQGLQRCTAWSGDWLYIHREITYAL